MRFQRICGGRARVVKGSDSKSVAVSARRFESFRPRLFFFIPRVPTGARPRQKLKKDTCLRSSGQPGGNEGGTHLGGHRSADGSRRESATSRYRSRGGGWRILAKTERLVRRRECLQLRRSAPPRPNSLLPASKVQEGCILHCLASHPHDDGVQKGWRKP